MGGRLHDRSLPDQPSSDAGGAPRACGAAGATGVPRQGFERGEGQAGLSSADEGKVHKQDLACCRWAAVSVLLVCGGGIRVMALTTDERTALHVCRPPQP